MKNAEELLKELTLEEKVALVSGYNFMRTNPVPRLNIPSIKFSDGPHGLRAQVDGGDNGVTNSLPATCFPTASCSANTFRPELLRKMGNAMAEEAKYYGVSVLLGPGVNIKRNPRCGRNFEYFSEDPFLAGRMGAEEVKGIQENDIGVSMKHFACNNSENYRFMGNSIVDKRALREIYLRQFEYVVKEAHPETLMCAYNAINGTYSCENSWLLNDVLRKEWGFKGLVMSDWGATHNRVKGVESGLDLEMPGDTTICRKWLADAVKNGSLKEERLDEAVKNVLTLVYKHKDAEKIDVVDWDAHHKLAKEIAVEGAVLLKNEEILPLKEGEKLLVVGELFERARYQGAGSSMINPKFKVSCKEAFDKNSISYKYVKGYHEFDDDIDQKLIDEAVETSKDYDKVVLFMGLTDRFESEGSDRKDIKLPQNQLALVDALVKENKKIVIVLFGGSVVELPFYDSIDGLLNMFLAGQDSGDATFDLLFGRVSPSGRLSETWPIKYEDVPFGNEYSTCLQDVYKESIYVGYRYYMSANKEVRFPFGYGLSYTTFETKNLKVERKENSLFVSVDVTNIGDKKGSEVVQVYVSLPRENVDKPVRELKGFKKVDLNQKETKTVVVEIKFDDLKFFDISQDRFVLEEGEYDIQICKNSLEILTNSKIFIKGEKIQKSPGNPYKNLKFEEITNEKYEEIFNIKIPQIPNKKPIRIESRLSDLKSTLMGKILYGAMQSVAKKEFKKAKKLPDGLEKENKIKGAEFLKVILDSNSLISLSMSSSGQFPYNFAQGFVNLSNGHLIKGIKNFIKKIDAPKLPIEMEEK